MNRTVCAGIVLIAVLGMMGLPAGPARADSTIRFSHETLGYSLTYPREYALKRLGQAVTVVWPFKDPVFGFSPNVSIVSDKLNTPLPDLGDFYKDAKKQLNSAYKGIRIIEEKKEKINGVEAYKIVYTAQEKKALFKFLQYVLIVKGRAYVVTYTALQDQFTPNLSSAQAIIRSLAFGK